MRVFTIRLSFLNPVGFGGNQNSHPKEGILCRFEYGVRYADQPVSLVMGSAGILSKIAGRQLIEPDRFVAE